MRRGAVGRMLVRSGNFEVSDGVVTAVTAHEKHQEEWDEFFV